MATRAQRKSAWSNDEGNILVAVLGTVFVMTLLGIAMFDLATIEASLATRSHYDYRAQYAAEAGLLRAFSSYSKSSNPLPWPAVNTPNVIYTLQTLSYDSSSPSPSTQAAYTVTATALTTSAANPARITLVSEACFPALASPCPGTSGWAKVQTTIQKTPSNIGLNAITIGQTLSPGQQGGTGNKIDSYDSSVPRSGCSTPPCIWSATTTAKTNANILVNGNVDFGGSEPWNVKGNIKSATGWVSGSASTAVTGSVTAAGTIYGNIQASALVPDSPSPSVVLPTIAPCGPPYSNWDDQQFQCQGNCPNPYNQSTGNLTFTQGTLDIRPNPAAGSGGKWCFNNITLGSNLRVVGGPVIINMTGAFTVTTQGRDTNISLPQNLQIYSSYATSGGSCVAEPGNVPGVSFAAGSTVNAFVYAPCSTVDFKGGNFAGAFMGKTVQFGDNVGVHYDEKMQLSSLSNLPAGVAQWLLVSTPGWCRYPSRSSSTPICGN